MHVFYSQGGGLGHLTRVDKLILKLQIPVEDVIIITSSIFTKYFNKYTHIKLSWNVSPSVWAETLQNVINKTEITAFYIDTFPFGLKGELISIFKKFPDANYIYISRILKWDIYLKNFPNIIAPVFSKTILLEPLYPKHFNWIEKQSKQIESINLAPKTLPKPISFIDAPYILVIHSGGKNDVIHICNQVLNDNALTNKTKVIVFTQVKLSFNHPKFKIYNNVYPVSQYFEKAKKIYTAGGFNLINELHFFKDKHISIPLEKLYDDQFFRISSQK